MVSISGQARQVDIYDVGLTTAFITPIAVGAVLGFNGEEVAPSALDYAVAAATVSAMAAAGAKYIGEGLEIAMSRFSQNFIDNFSSENLRSLQRGSKITGAIVSGLYTAAGIATSYAAVLGVEYLADKF